MRTDRKIVAVPALALGVGALALAGGFDGWIAQAWAFRSTRCTDPLTRIQRLSHAVAADPLSPRHRRALDEALGEAIAEAGAKEVADVAPAEPVPRSRFIAALAGADPGEPIARLASGLAPRTRLELETLDRQSLVVAARALATNGRCAEAMPLFDAFTVRSTSAARIDLDVGRCWLELGSPDKAIPYLDRARERDGESRWPRLARAEALLSLARLPEAEKESAALVRDLPDFYYGWYLRGRVLLEAGRAADATKALERAVALGAGDGESEFWPRYHLAKARLEAGDVARALAESQALARERPEAAAVWDLHGRSLLAAGRAKEAAAALEWALAFGAEGDDPYWVRYHLAEALLASGDAARAEVETKRLVEARPNVAAAWTLHGRSLLALGKAADAVRALEQAVAAHAPGERALWPRFHLAEAYLASGAADRSERLAGELVAEDARFYYGWHLRARAFEALGRAADAAGAYRRALTLRPANRWLEPRIAELDARARASGSAS